MTIIAFPGHKWTRCKDPECSGCCYCRGGLANCEVCGGAEVELPTDCPGTRMLQETREQIAEGILDYRRDRGWFTPSGRTSSTR